jgi:hypothetical protein
MWVTIFSKLAEMMLDDGKHSFGKTVSFPFLVTVWVVGTWSGVQQVLKSEDVNDWIWTMAGVAMVIYASYKTGAVLIKRNRDGRVETTLPTKEEAAPSE